VRELVRAGDAGLRGGEIRNILNISNSTLASSQSPEMLWGWFVKNTRDLYSVVLSITIIAVRFVSGNRMEIGQTNPQ